MNRLYRNYTYRFLHNPLFYLFSLIYVLAVGMGFYFGGGFFSYYSTTDLHSFFKMFPYASVLYFPFLCTLLPSGKTESSWPFSGIEISAVRLFSLISAFAVVLFSSLIVVLCISFFGNVELSQLFSGIMGLLLYGLCGMSFCVFVFSSFESQGLSFVICSIFLGITDTIHLIPFYTNVQGALGGICKFLSFAWHFDSFGKGIIDSRDFVFFSAFSLLFVLLSYFAEEKRRGNIGKDFKKFKYLSLGFILLFIFDFSNLYFRIDLTKNKKYSTGKLSHAVLEQISEPLYITYYCSGSLRNSYPQIDDVNDFLNEYSLKNKNVFLKKIDPHKYDMESMLDSAGVFGTPVRTNSRKDNSISYVYSAITIDYLGMQRIIPFVLNTNTLEYDLTRNIQSLMFNSHDAVQVLVGNGFSLDSEYSFIKPWFESQNIMVVESCLPEDVIYGSNYNGKSVVLPFTSYPDVPLFIFGTAHFSSYDALLLSDFISAGGKVFVATSPYTVDINNNWDVVCADDNVIFMLQKYGLYFGDEMICDLNNARLSLSSNDKNEMLNYSLWPVLTSQVYLPKGMQLYWLCAIDTDNEISRDAGFESFSFANTSKFSWGLEKTGGTFVVNPFFVPKVPQDKNLYSVNSIGAALRNDSGISVIAIGDQYAFSSSMLPKTSSEIMDTRSLEFVTDVYFVLTGQESIIELKNKNVMDKSLYKVSQEDFSGMIIKTLLWSVLVPVIIFLSLGFAFCCYKKRLFK